MKTSKLELLVYIIAWMLFSAIHAVFMFMSLQLPFKEAIIDSLIHNTLLFLAGSGFYFVRRFNQHQKHIRGINKSIQNIFTYLVALAFWYIVADPLLSYYAMSNPVYAQAFDSFRLLRPLLAAFMLLLIMVMLNLYFVFLNFKESSIREAKLNTLLRESELQALRWQINPHFLFNSLNSISYLTISKPQGAQSMVIKLAELLRYSLRNGGHQLTSLSDELYHTKLYLDIEKERFGNRLNIDLQCSDDCLSLKLPSLILQPLIENAIKHGINSTENISTIAIYCRCDKGFLEIDISNTYDPEGRSLSGTGTGLKNIQERIKLIYESDSLMRIIDQDFRFCVYLRFPQL